MVKRFKKLFALGLIAVSLTTSTVTPVYAANASRLSEGGIKSYTWSVNNQGYRVYIEDKNGKRVSKILDITYTDQLPSNKKILYRSEDNNGSNKSDKSDKSGRYKTANSIKQTDITVINFKKLSDVLGADKYIPIGVGYKIDNKGNVSYDVYRAGNGKSAMLAWLMGEDNKYYAFVSGTNKKADYKTIQDAFDATSDTMTIYVDSGTYIERINGISKSSGGSTIYSDGMNEGRCIVGLSQYNSRPLIMNTNVAESKIDIELGEYNNQPLMMAYGFVKDIDMYQTVGYDQFHRVLDPATGERYKMETAMSYAFHCESTASKDKHLSFENCTFKNNGGYAVGMGLYSGMEVKFKDCVMESTLASSGGSVFMHDCGNPDAQYQGESKVLFNNSMFKTRSIFSGIEESKANAPDAIAMFNYKSFAGADTSNFGQYTFLNTKLDNDTDNDVWIQSVGSELVDGALTMNTLAEKKLNVSGNGIKNTEYDVGFGDISNSKYGGKETAELADKAMSNSSLVEIYANSLTGAEDMPRLSKLLNIKVDGVYLFNNEYGDGLKVGDEGEDGETLEKPVDVLCENNYRLIIEPLVWVTPAKSVDGVYSGSDTYIYGDYASVLAYLADNTSKYGDGEDCNVYNLFETIYNACKK